MKIAIIEDEVFAARRLENMIREFDASIEVVVKLESVKESIEWFSENEEPDLIFLDIHLEDNLSFAIFKAVPITSFIVFTTATDELATRAFALMGIDYLLKPIVQNELNRMIEKYRNKPNSDRKAINPDMFDSIINKK
jgi:two-component system, LytTR family, response regulator LytT